MTKEEGIKDLVDKIIALERQSGEVQELLYKRYGVRVCTAYYDDYVNINEKIVRGVRLHLYKGLPEVAKILGLEIIKTGVEHRSAYYGNVDISTVTSNYRMRKAERRNNKWTRGEMNGN